MKKQGRSKGSDSPAMARPVLGKNETKKGFKMKIIKLQSRHFPG